MKKSYLWTVALLAAALLAWLLLGSSEEQRILDRLEQIRTLSEIREQEDAVTGLGKARRLGNLFTAQTRYDLTTLGHGITHINSRDELVQKIVAGRNRLVSLELGILAPEVSIDGEHATLELTGTALGATHGGQGQFMDVHRIEIELVREDGDWLVRGGRHLRDERATFEGR